jgi:hypothetical protein
MIAPPEMSEAIWFAYHSNLTALLTLSPDTHEDGNERQQ